MSRDLLEREPELAELRAAAREAAAGHGRVVLLHGEAGIGKTSLANALRAEPPDGTRVLIGSCDAMSTPRTLGPLRDLASAVGPRLGEALRAGDREEVFESLRDELAATRGTVLIVEDVHWADEATLDVLRFLARRIADLPAVLVLTYRDELDRDHPLSRLLGDLGHGDHVERFALRHLSADAVGALTAGSGLDADRVYAMTEGNPYFVSELVASADEAGVPPTVVDAVTGRLRRLDEATQDHVEQLAVAALGCRRHLAREVDSGVRRRVAHGGGGRAAGSQPRERQVPSRTDPPRDRRRAARLPPDRARAPSARSNCWRRASPTRRPLVHHALAAGDIDAVVAWAPRAARDAAASGAHRQSTAHFLAALEHIDRYDAAERAELLEGYAIEAYTIGQGPECGRGPDGGRAAAARATRRHGARREPALAFAIPVARGNRPAGRGGGPRGVGRARRLGESRPARPGAEQRGAAARCSPHELPQAIDLATRAVTIAREVGEPRALSHALNNLGTAHLLQNRDEGIAELLESADIAVAANLMDDAARAHVNLVWSLLDQYRLDLAERYLEPALELSERTEVVGLWTYQQAERGRLHLAPSASGTMPSPRPGISPNPCRSRTASR